MTGTPDLAEAVRLVADPSRAAILIALADGRALPAGELAYRAGITAQTASTHLARLVDGGWLAVERTGRHRYYRLADPTVAERLEALALIAPSRPQRLPRRSGVPEALRGARTCYDHLAGRLGVAVTAALVEQGVLAPAGQEFAVTPGGQARLAALGIDLDAARQQRRRYAYACLDWSERRPHLGGAVGAALTSRLFELGWLRRPAAGRAVALTDAGRAGLEREFGLSGTP